MNRMNFALARVSDTDLERMIEPLASYISAANQPRVVLASALKVLFHEVKETNRAANLHVNTYTESFWT